jgi:hypothetical protein
MLSIFKWYKDSSSLNVTLAEYVLLVVTLYVIRAQLGIVDERNTHPQRVDCSGGFYVLTQAVQPTKLRFFSCALS